jgi:ArsR family transcriptional regulator
MSATQDVPPLLQDRPIYNAAPSLACDLSWVLSVAADKPHTAENPLRNQSFDGREELREQVRTFWNDGQSDTCFAEMQILAHHGGAICATSPDELWAAVRAAIETCPLDLGLESEPPEDRDRFLARIAALRRSPELTQRYLALLQAVWEPLDALWQAALPVLREAGAHTLRQLEQGRPFADLVRVECDSYRARLPVIAAQLEAGHHGLLVTPCLFFGRSCYLEFPGLTLIGSGVHEHGAMARARTESVARRLKTVADPTRLALLHFLATRPSSVSDLASSFGLAQPTVSMHVKLLRETGLVTAERQSGRLQLRADAGAVDTLLSDLRAVVVQTPAIPQGDSTTGNERMPATVVDATRSATPVTA